MARRSKFYPSAPGTTLWIAAIILGVLGIIAHFTHINELSKYNYEMLLLGYLLLAFGTTYRRV